MPAPSKGKHNRRQRKKLRLGEFQEFGFEVTAETARELAPAERDTFVDALVAAADERGLLLGGGFQDTLELFAITDAENSSATEEQRESLKTWLVARAELKNVEVGPLKDAWHGR